MPSDLFRVSLRRTLLASLACLISIFLLFFIPSILGGLLTMSILPVLHGIGLGFFAVVYSFFVVVLWGVPSHLVFIYFRVKAVWLYLASGFLGGPLFLILVRPFGVDPVETLLRQIAFLGGFGLLASFVFWYVAVKGDDSEPQARGGGSMPNA